MDLSQLFLRVNNNIGVWVWPAGGLALAIVFILALWMGAALAGVEKLTFLKALWIAPVLLVVLAPAGYGIFSAIFGGDMREWVTLQNLAIGIGLMLLVDLVLIVAALFPLAEATPGQSIILWLLRLPILGLLAALVGGGVFVTMAIAQASTEPRGQQWLTYIGWFVAGVVVLALAIFFGTRMTQSSGGPRRTTA
jgi:hypothetical protein